MKKLMFLLAIIAILVACNSNDEQIGELVTENGMISRLNESSWDYGTHLLSRKNKNFLALKSSNINLSEYVGKDVKIVGWKIIGYPKNNGPEYIDVSKVVENTK